MEISKPKTPQYNQKIPLLNLYPGTQAAYSMRKLNSNIGVTHKREMSGYISTWYDQSGNNNHAYWNFETETKSKIWDLQHEISQDFLDLAIELGIEINVKFPSCVIRVGLESATVNI